MILWDFMIAKMNKEKIMNRREVGEVEVEGVGGVVEVVEDKKENTDIENINKYIFICMIEIINRGNKNLSQCRNTFE